MKDYLKGTRYNKEQKRIIMELASIFYKRYGIGNKGIGWNVCEDEDRVIPVRMAIEIYLDVVEPYAIKVKEDLVNRIKATFYIEGG